MEDDNKGEEVELLGFLIEDDDLVASDLGVRFWWKSLVYIFDGFCDCEDMIFFIYDLRNTDWLGACLSNNQKKIMNAIRYWIYTASL